MQKELLELPGGGLTIRFIVSGINKQIHSMVVSCGINGCWKYATNWKCCRHSAAAGEEAK